MLVPNDAVLAKDLVVGQMLTFGPRATRFLEVPVKFPGARLIWARTHIRPLTILQVEPIQDGLKVRIQLDLGDGLIPMWFVFNHGDWMPVVDPSQPPL